MDPALVFYLLLAVGLVLSVALLVAAGRRDKAERELGMSAGGGEAKLSTRDESPKGSQQLKMVITDNQNRWVRIDSCDSAALFAPLDAEKRLLPTRLPDDLKQRLQQIIVDAAGKAKLLPSDGWYELQLSHALLVLIDSDVHAVPSEVVTKFGAGAGLTLLQSWRLANRADQLERADLLLRKLSNDADGVDRSALDDEARRDVQAAYAYAATFGPVIVEQRFDMNSIATHCSQLEKLDHDLAFEYSRMMGGMLELEKFFAGVNFARAGHKSRVAKLKEHIAQFSSLMSAASLILEARCTLLVLKHLLPGLSETRQNELQVRLVDLNGVLDRTRSLRVKIEEKLPDLNSFLGNFMRGHHERQRNELSTALQETLTPIEVRFADVIGTLKMNLDQEKLMDGDGGNGAALSLLVHSNGQQVQEVRRRVEFP